MTPGEKVAAIAKYLGFSSVELAELAMISPTEVLNFESGASQPSAKTLQIASKLFGTTVESLTNGKSIDEDMQDRTSMKLANWNQVSNHDQRELKIFSSYLNATAANAKRSVI